MNAAKPEFRSAKTEDLSAIISLLAECGLPAEDLGPASLVSFELAFDPNGRIVGIVGLDISGRDALLRSLAIAPDWRGTGLGAHLVARREAAAVLAGVSALYLLTTTVAGLFRRLGYVDVLREVVPVAIAAHAQFRSLCPASAKCLGKRL